jgi:uncharacterized membrane protein YgaE (UPF0421/DUF939 family)
MLARIVTRLTSSRRIFKTALAAGLAWWVAEWLAGSKDPYFAPLAAILTLQVTVAETIAYSVQRVLGVVVGVCLAAFVFGDFNVDALSIGALVGLGMLGAQLVGLGPQATAQVAISGLLVMAVGQRTPGYATHRIIDTVIGVCVAVVINATIAPASHLEALAAALTSYCEKLAELLTELAASLREHTPERSSAALTKAREVNHDFADVRAALSLSEQGLKWHYSARRNRQVWNADRAVAEALEKISILARTMSRTMVEDGKPAPDLSAFSNLLDECARLCGLLGRAVSSGDRELAQQVVAEATRLAAEGHLVETPAPQAPNWRHAGALLTDAERILQTLVEAASSLHG